MVTALCQKLVDLQYALQYNLPAMTAEAPRPEGAPDRDPIQVAREGVNKELFSVEYNPGLLVLRAIQLKNTLVEANLSTSRISNEITIIAGQGAQRAESRDDQTTASILRELQKSVELLDEKFKTKTQLERTEGIQLSCLTCKHEWNYKGKRVYASCPDCKRSVRTGYKPVQQQH